MRNDLSLVQKLDVALQPAACGRKWAYTSLTFGILGLVACTIYIICSLVTMTRYRYWTRKHKARANVPERKRWFVDVWYSWGGGDSAWLLRKSVNSLERRADKDIKNKQHIRTRYQSKSNHSLHDIQCAN